MTATSVSHVFSGCFVPILIWASCTPVVCLVDDAFAVYPDTTPGYHSPVMTAEPVHGVTHEPFACGNITDICPSLCDFCHTLLPTPRIDCLSVFYDHMCLLNFKTEMNKIRKDDWCSWGRVKGLYSNFSMCTEQMSDCLLIPWPNSEVEQLFVNIHTEYFNDCTTEELRDPPEAIVFALVMTPICLIPVMVSLVVLKTKNGDGSS